MPEFDPLEKERQLRAEAEAWDTTEIFDARDGDIPIIDLAPYLETESQHHLEAAASKLRRALEEVGFFCLKGHGVPSSATQNAFDAARRFHALPINEKRAILMDRPGWPLGGVGYLPLKNQKLPARNLGNYNEAFILKGGWHHKPDDNQWLPEEALPDFRANVEAYVAAMLGLSKRLLSVFAVALEMPRNYFDEAFTSPFYRLRMTHYPPIARVEQDDFGIAPHVDTSFCTILAQDAPGLTIYSERRKAWIRAPFIEDSLIVNAGELLKQWTNDRFLSVKHFANNNVSGRSRYSIPFFLNANADYLMTCIPSCCGPENPPKYPPLSYVESQAIAQGE